MYVCGTWVVSAIFEGEALGGWVPGGREWGGSMLRVKTGAGQVEQTWQGHRQIGRARGRRESKHFSTLGVRPYRKVNGCPLS